MEPETKETKKEAGGGKAEQLPEAAAKAAAVSADRPSAFRGRHEQFRGPERGKRFPRKGPREERTRPEFDQKILTIRRVARVAAGGRRFNFSVAIVIGNRKGSVAVGTGKGADTALAIDKAVRNGKKNLFRVSLAAAAMIPHRVESKYGSARVLLMPAPGRGLVAGSAVRDVLLLAGIRDTVGKILSGSKNKLNNARAAVEALKKLSTKARPGKAEEAKEEAAPVQPDADAEAK